MKNIIKKVTALLCVAALLFTAIPMMSAAAEEAAATPIVVFAEGNGTEGSIFHPGGYSGPDRIFNGTYYGWQNNHMIRTGVTKDFSGCTDITMQLYFTDTDAYNYWLPHMYLMFTSNDGTNTVNVRYPLPAGITAGVNIITVNLESLIKQGLDVTCIYQVAVKTLPSNTTWWTGVYTDMNNGYTDANAPEFRFNIQKIYGIKKEAAATENELFIANGDYKFWGYGAQNFNYANFEYNLPAAVDVSGYDFIEYDLYVSDADALRLEKTDDVVNADGSVTAGTYQWSSSVVRLGTNGSSFAAFGNAAADLKTGYNHIKIPVSSLGAHASSLQHIYLYHESNQLAHAPSNNYVFGILNIKATSIESPEVTEGSLIHEGGDMKIWNKGNNANWANQKLYLDAATDLSGYNKIYFDFYVSDVEALKAETNFSSYRLWALTSDELYANFYQFSFQDQLKQDGWNHVELVMDQGAKSGAADWSTVKSFQFHIEANATTIASQAYYFKIANISVGRPDTFVFLEDAGEYTWATGYNRDWSTKDYFFDITEDFSNIDYIEFDYYVDDLDSLKALENFSSFNFWVRTSEELWTNIYAIGFTDQVTQSGWNHIKLDKNLFGRIGSPDWKNVTGVHIHMETGAMVADKDYVFHHKNFTAVTLSATAHRMFGNNMLFQQNKPVTVSGTGTAGSAVAVQLVKDGSVVSEASGAVGTDGVWELTMDCAISGGYDTYELVVLANGNEAQRFTGVVFGELWLAFGQSNMELRMWETPEGDVYYDTATFPNANIHVYTNSNSYATRIKDPRAETTGSWILGNTQSAHNVSAVGYWFANTLQQELDMPVGFLDSPLGGTNVEAWLSRETIEADAELKALMQANNVYISYEDFDANAKNHSAATNCYNQLAPLEVFNIAGAIWYQGEGNIAHTQEYYEKALGALIDSYSQSFGFDGAMPFIITHLAPYAYNGIQLPTMWETQSNVWAKYEDTAAQTPIYDVSLEWNYADWAAYGNGGDPIHPVTKKPVGERMGKEALALVYGIGEEHTAPVFDSFSVSGRYVDVKFDHVGSGLASLDGKSLKGFTVAGADGVYVNAKAEIISEDTVRVWSDNVASPAAVAYAFNSIATSANLANTSGGEIFQMAAPFRSSVVPNAAYLGNTYWMSADIASAWHTIGVTPDIYDVWSGTNATVSIDTEDKYHGDGSVKAEFAAGEFSVSPVLVPDLTQSFKDVSYDYSKFATLTFKLKSDVAATLTGVTVNNGGTAVALAVTVDHNSENSAVVAGEWIDVSVDLTSAGVALNNVRAINFGFASDVAGIVRLDDFSLTTAEQEPYDVNGDGKVNVLDIVRMKKALAGQDVATKSSSGDVDGTVGTTATDLVALRKFILFL